MEKVKAWLRKNKPTRLPGYGDPEFAQIHVRRMQKYDAAGMREKAEMLRKGLIP
jgi:hypothetical protein